MKFSQLQLISFYKAIADYLATYGINPILYGSVGASLYLGNFKTFNDIDLLIEDAYIKTKWPYFKELMASKGFKVIDEKEHEFENDKGLRLAFAEQNVLVRDEISNLTTDIVFVKFGEIEVRTLKPEGFLRAYEFSLDDGYRLAHRDKKDAEAIKLLKEYLEATTNET